MENKMYFEQFWRNAKLEDAIKQPSMVGRYKNDNGDWEIFNLTGYDSKPETSNHHWIFSNCCSDNAQVYDPPANFELGDGYEFVDAKKEPKAKDVEFWYHDWGCGYWEKRPDYYGDLNLLDIYRRKIKPKLLYRPMQLNEIVHSKCLFNNKKNDQSLDPIAPGWTPTIGWSVGGLAADNPELNFACPIGEPVESYEPFTWEDRNLILGKKIISKDVEHKIAMLMFDVREFKGKLYINDISSKYICENCIFDDTKLPVGKKVTKTA